jgi:hypothetical protein
LLHDNIQLHTAEEKDKVIGKIRLGKLWLSPLYSCPGTSRLYEYLGSKRIATHEKVKETVTDWYNGLVADFYDKAIVNLCNIWTNA